MTQDDMTQKEAALAYLERDRLRYLGLVEVLRRHSGDLLYAGKDGVLLYDRWSTAYMLTAETQKAAEDMLARIPAEAKLCLAHESWYLPALREKLGLEVRPGCHQVAWLEETPPAPSPLPGEIIDLDRRWTAWVSAHYGHSYADEAYIAQAIGRGMLGAFVEGELAGFIGTHDEGTVGLLKVLPEYRRRGVAEALHRAMIGRVLARGGIPFSHVEVGNEASMALQKKVGMAVSEHLVYWMF